MNVSKWILFVCFASMSVLVALEKEPDVVTNVSTVPPPGVAPFDPKPLMAKVNERLTTDTFRFAVLGDAKHAKTLPALLTYLDGTLKPDFVLTTGDMVSTGGGKVGPGYYEMLTTQTGPEMRKRPWWPAIGNHELAGGAITGRDALVEDSEQLRKNQISGIENFKKFYNLENEIYSFTCRNCYFIALPFRYPTGKHIEWLEAELKKATEAKQHIIVFNHAPFFTVGLKTPKEIPNKESDVTALFQKYHVTAVFSGHDHGYYRTVRSGIPYFTSAGGGASIYPGARTKEALPEDVYYYGDPASFAKGSKEKKYVLHKNDGSPDKISNVSDQFLCIVDVDGNKITCFTVTTKGEKWDEIVLSK
ncbi:MAG: metallophosphoesterase [Planctomycetota bacterium]